MARTKNTQRGIGRGQRGRQRGVAAAKFPQKEKEKEDEPVASSSKATPPDLNIKSGAPKRKQDPPMKLTMQQKILREQKSTDLCCSKHFFVK